MISENNKVRVVTMFVPLYRVDGDPNVFEVGMTYKTRKEAENASISSKLIRVVPITHSI